MQNSSKKLTYKTSKTVGKEDIFVTIQLADECKNGHQDFSITGDIYEAGKPKSDRYHIAGGCIHEDIAKHFPQFIPFIKLHLCDWQGIPMYAADNGFYHLRNGLDRTPITAPNFKNKYCEYYRITDGQFDELSMCANNLQYSIKLSTLGILEQWKIEANEAIKQLEQLTDTEFLPDSVKSNYIAPTEGQLLDEKNKVETGYYTAESEAKREADKLIWLIDKLAADRDKALNKATNEFEVKKEVLIKGGKKALDNCIFYTHTNQLAFNWKDSDKLPADLLASLIPTLQLPEGVTVK
jgi:hypothetical protein